MKASFQFTSRWVVGVSLNVELVVCRFYVGLGVIWQNGVL